MFAPPSCSPLPAPRRVHACSSLALTASSTATPLPISTHPVPHNAHTVSPATNLHSRHPGQREGTQQLRAQRRSTRVRARHHITTPHRASLLPFVCAAGHTRAPPTRAAVCSGHLAITRAMLALSSSRAAPGPCHRAGHTPWRHSAILAHRGCAGRGGASAARVRAQVEQQQAAPTSSVDQEDRVRRGGGERASTRKWATQWRRRAGQRRRSPPPCPYPLPQPPPGCARYTVVLGKPLGLVLEEDGNGGIVVVRAPGVVGACSSCDRACRCC